MITRIPSSRTPARSRQGFTLIELLTVIAIIGILAAIIIPTVGAVRKRAKSVQCLSNLRQLAMGCQLFAQEHKDWYPQWSEKPTPTKANPFPPEVAWYLALASYTGQKVGAATSDDTRGSGLIYQCPGSELPILGTTLSTYTTHTWLFLQRDSVSTNNLPPKMSRIARPSQTVVFGDGPQAENGGASNGTMWHVSGTGNWSEGRDPNEASPTIGDVDTAEGRGYLRYRHGNSTNVAFVDAHVASMVKGTLKNSHFLLTK